MQEFRNGEFGDIVPARTLLEQMARSVSDNAADIFPDLKAVHFGTQQELEKIRAQKDEFRPVLVDPVDVTSLKDRVDELEKRFAEEAMQHHTEGVRVYPASALHRINTNVR